MKRTLIIIAAVVAVVLTTWFVVMGIENKAIAYEEAIENTAGNIRVEEKRRFDLIPNLVDCVKQYDEYEYNVITEAVKARNMSSSESVSEVKNLITAVAEAYPELKAQKNYQELMNALAITENRISDFRKFYNRNVTDYKRYVRVFPSKQILSLRGYEVKDYERLEFEHSSVDAPTNIFGK